LLIKVIAPLAKQHKKIKKIICNCGDFDFNAIPALTVVPLYLKRMILLKWKKLNVICF
jgi:hypothetical protein